MQFELWGQREIECRYVYRGKIGTVVVVDTSSVKLRLTASPLYAHPAAQRPRAGYARQIFDLLSLVASLPQGEALGDEQRCQNKGRPRRLESVAFGVVVLLLCPTRKGGQDLSRHHDGVKSGRAERGSECCWLSQAAAMDASSACPKQRKTPKA